jgi:3-hydroxyacyl-CoA dehydrogenase/3a,7a,12a-trihydroxy-5b-cholest-24-enoyl-CoA hydratase/multifunctional beta-oxidation protein/peroxisomal enoyl-CoA hydratase 2
VIGFESENCKSSCSNKDAITYAIGIGYGLEAKIEDLQYTYELHEDFKVFPTYATCLH